MTVDIKTYVVGLLESYQKRSKQIDLLHYELSHPTDISENEMISALALSQHCLKLSGADTESWQCR